MALIHDVKAICDRLAPLGWRELLRATTGNALDIDKPTASALQQELTKAIAIINRSVPGFEDFASSGNSGVAAGQPSQSLLYHALASPLVTRDHQGIMLKGFPTPLEIDLLENFIFSLANVTLAQIVQQQGGPNKVAMVIFTSEYRPAKDSVDGRHADLTFSRTGIARVGTSRARYNAATRGFWPEDEDNPHNFRAVPARYSAWIAAKKKGKDVRVSPILDNSTGQMIDEPSRDFWVPVHKLFTGNECLRGLDLTPRLVAKLFNLKIQRIHKRLKTNPLPNRYPYVLKDKEIADWSTVPEFGPGWLEPTVHGALVETAMVDGKRITFKVPKGKGSFGALEFEGGAPAYVHARTKVKNDGSTIDLNDEANVIAIVNKGDYQAQHYVDFTGEGWITVELPQIDSISVVPAYALISAPDFFPSSGQFELSEWSRSSEVPATFRGKIWLPQIPPTPLSETRVPANLQLPGSPFSRSDDTVTAIVAMGSPATPPLTVSVQQPDAVRSSMLPDDAAGFFAPGWDVSMDEDSEGSTHLAGYGLGSPFPEDAKLCAALSTFWPAVAPDVFRTFATPIGRTSGTVAPLTDDEIGQTGTLPWDGIRGPSVVTENGKRFVELHDFVKADYIHQALENRFSQRLLARVSSEEYKARILAICRVYGAVGNLGDIRITRDNWLALSFREVIAGDQELQIAQTQAGTILTGKVYRVDLCKFVPDGQRLLVPGMPRLKRFPLQDLRSFFASAESIFVLTKRETDSTWASARSEPEH